MGSYGLILPNRNRPNLPTRSRFCQSEKLSDPISPTRLPAGYSKRTVWTVYENLVQPYHLQCHYMLNYISFN